MKHTLRYAAIVSLMVLATSCNRFDDPMVIEGEGVWNILSHKTEITDNGVVVLDSTATNAGTINFERSGRAILTNPYQIDTLTWEDYPKENRLIMYRKHGPWMNCEIVKRTNNAMTLQWANESDEATGHRVTAGTLEIERVK